MKHFTLSVLALSALAVGGCSEQSPAPTEVASIEPQFAVKGGGTKTEESDPMTRWVFQASFTDASGAEQPYGITGDGAGPYEGGLCGVHAKIFWTSGNSGGDAVFDPDMNRPGKCTPRFLNFALPGRTTSQEGPFTNVLRIMDTELNVPRSQHMRFTSLKLANCERIQYGKPTASDTDPVWATEEPGVRVTRTDGAARTRGGGKWIVESEPPHEAQCYVWSGGTYVTYGDRFTLPFRAEIEELPSNGPETY